MIANRATRAEWPTLAAIAACYTVWGTATWLAPQLSGWEMAVAGIFAVLATTFHSSLQHECLHGHPTRRAGLNEALVFLPVGLFVPYRRFKVLHLRHHRDETLTDPYDDPETWYLAEAGWDGLSALSRVIFVANNTLAGRLLIGPTLALIAFFVSEAKLLMADAPGIRRAWLLHLAGLVPVAAWLVGVCGWSLPVYAIAVAYPAMGVLMIRTFAEHQASQHAGARTVIIEKSGLLSLLFLNNNLHFVHHRHPAAPWYDLPGLYRLDRAAYREENGGYVYPSYADLARRYLFRAKEPVAHPFLRRRTGS